MQVRRGIIDFENYFSETFKPITNPLNRIAKQNKKSFKENNDDLSDLDFENSFKSASSIKK